jgi:hypothetical protein
VVSFSGNVAKNEPAQIAIPRFELRCTIKELDANIAAIFVHMKKIVRYDVVSLRLSKQTGESSRQQEVVAIEYSDPRRRAF